MKEGLSELCAIHLAPVDARKLIGDRIQEAVEKAGKMAPLTVGGEVTLEIQREEPGPARLKPGSERVDAFTVRWSGEHVWQVFNHAVYGKPDLPLPE